MRRTLSLLIVGASLAGVHACGAPAWIDVRDYPPQMQADYRLFADRCTRCHGIDRPLNARVADGGWDSYVRRMSRHPGAGLSEPEQRRIARFLEYHHQRRREARP